ncbi:hypothetical protein [Kitasatospora sp. NPDC090091]|uniref:hypothetical protein n=1 Tax=Kitasatospora sp. NPDC090091 TaxID=3364081 RepID=UPI00380488E6
MAADPRALARRWAVLSCVPVLLLAAIVACDPSPEPRPADAPPGGQRAAAAGAAAVTAAPAAAVAPDPAGTDRGLAAERDGYRLDATATELPVGRATGYSFTITGPDGRPVTDFEVHQTRKLHFYAIRSDLTGFQHLHPEMAADGTWTADLAALTPGSWRLYASFLPSAAPHHGTEIVLSRVVTVPGTSTTVPLPAPAGTATVDGYTVALTGEPMAGAYRLTATVTKDGRPVTDLQPYLDSYAHLTAFHEGDQALAHLHPADKADADHGGGPVLTFHAMLATAGNWRVFLQFQTAGRLHTAELTLNVAA